MRDEQKSEKAIFLEAAEITSDPDRAAYLDAVCGNDRQLREDVEKLLTEHAESHALLDACATVDLPGRERPGAQIGPYRLLQEIGEGGMGVVYMAEQAVPVKRRVALKIVKPGMDSRQIIARFEAERQALAMMDHPNVARVLDAGTTRNGRPYFVMELVKGVPITTYCNENQLNVRQRLELFIAVCQAVQHAHHKGIIHRDIKPSNVLVADYDDQGIPKIIDFGVAKALSQSLTDKTVFTQFGQIMGTLQYMSPEQAKFNQLDVDTRSDIYSLGVLLYELLTGTTPMERERLRSSDLNEVVRIIGAEEPPKPSARLSTSVTLPTLAAQRGTEARKLTGLVRGELDWIVMQALEKDRTRRYETASALAADVDRYLHDQPVLACPPSVVYRMRKFLYRNRAAFSRVSAAAVIVLLALVAGTYAWKYNSGRRQLANQEFKSREKLAARDGQRRLEELARQEQIPEIERLVAQKAFVAAFVLAERVRQILPGDPRLATLRPVLSHNWSVVTEPEGADVYWRDYDNAAADWEYAGCTPIDSITLPRAMLLWRIQKDGFETVSGCRHPKDKNVSFTLERAGELPSGMVRVSGNAIRANFYGQQLDDIELDDFYVDRHEVTNRQFQKFVDAKGYETRALWEPELVVQDGGLTWDDVREFVDATGQPGPSTWSNGTFPEGQSEFPVQGVSWFEAMAFARFVGKELPTAVHWLRASGATRRTHGVAIAQQSNMNNTRPVAVASLKGIGPFGTSDTAGNVREWCTNEGDSGRRVILGGSWSEPIYQFSAYDESEPLERDSTCGLRCIKRTSGQIPVAALAPITFNDLRNLLEETPIDEEGFEIFRSMYAYDKTELRPQAISRFERDDVIHEVIEINAAYGGERFALNVFLPPHGKPPFQPIVYFPGAGKFEREQPFPKESKLWVWGNPRFTINSGRALVWPVYHGSFTRYGSYERDREWEIHVYRDLARTIDYLETRHDMDTSRIGYLGASLGARLAPIFLALEDRIRAAVLYHGGLLNVRVLLDQNDALNFAPRVAIPTLMINGRNDPVFPVRECQEPMFTFLGTVENKKAHLLFEGGHGTPAERWNPDAEAWFDRYLGPVGMPDERRQLISQASFAAARGQWGEAARHYVSAIESTIGQGTDEAEVRVWVHAGLAMLMAGQHDDYREHCPRMVERFSESDDPSIQEAVLQTCLITAKAWNVSNLSVAELMGAEAAASWPDNLRRSYQATRGLAALRGGESQEAIRWAQGATDGPPVKDDPVRALSRVILAMASNDLGDTSFAQDELAAAVRMIDASLPKVTDGQLDTRFVMQTQTLRHGWLIAELLRREAEGVLNVSSTNSIRD